jgi:hypothetical protein
MTSLADRIGGRHMTLCRVFAPFYTRLQLWGRSGRGEGEKRMANDSDAARFDGATSRLHRVASRAAIPPTGTDKRPF